MPLFRSLKGVRDLINSSSSNGEEARELAGFCDDLVAKPLEPDDGSVNNDEMKIGLDRSNDSAD